MDIIETNQYTQQEYRSTWEGEAGPGTMSAGVSSADALWFDKNDSLAEKLIFQTLGECGQEQQWLSTCMQMMKIYSLHMFSGLGLIT